jgi:NADPH:quinone reductase-like Zn-dependent oxidoreductase
MSTIKAAQIAAWGEGPKLVTIPKPALPTDDSTIQIKVLAAGIHRLVRSRASGIHFSANTLPHTLGSDGVGRAVPGGELVYFSTFWQTGSMAEYVNVPKGDVTFFPEAAKNTDPVKVAGMVNPAMSSWMALQARVFNPPENFSVLIVGATTTSGGIALTLAKKLGAGKVYGAARNVAAVKAMGYDGAIELKAEGTDWGVIDGHVDVILDYVYGDAIVQLFEALKPKRSIQYVQIGTLSTLTANIPGHLLRSKDLTLRGAAPGAYTGEQIAKELPDMIAAVATIDAKNFKIVDLKDIESAWTDEKSRIVVKISDDA